MKTVFLASSMIVLGALFANANPSANTPISIEQFIRIYQAQDFDFKTSKARLSTIEAQYRIDSDLYQTTLSLTPAYYKSEQTLLATNSSASDTGTEVSAKLTQTTSLGLSLQLTGTKQYPQENIPSSSYEDYRYSLGARLPLYKNSFGSAQGAKKSAALRAYEAAEFDLKNEALRACQTGAELYIRTWALQERATRLGEALKEAERALKMAESAFKRKLSRRIDWLSAQADHLKLKDTLAQARAEWSESKKLMQSYTAVDLLTDPKVYVLGAIDLNQKSTSLELSARERELKASELLLEATKSNQRSGFDLFFETGQGEVRDFSATPASYQEKYVKAGVQIDLPLISETQSAAVAQAVAERDRAQFNFENAERELKVKQAALPDTLASLKQKVENFEKRSALAEGQVKEASKLLDTGRIEFEDYLRFRDTYLNEILGGLELTLNLFRTKGDWARATAQENYLCGKKI